jgi:hypothetical protein
MGVMAIFVALSHSIASLFLPTPPRAEGGDTRDLVVHSKILKTCSNNYRKKTIEIVSIISDLIYRAISRQRYTRH